MRVVGRILVLLIAIVVLFPSEMLYSQKKMEKINRGLVAIREGDGYYLSWRLLGDEPWDTGFNIYRGENKLNSEPIVNVTSYVDVEAPLNSIYYVRAIVDGVEKVDILPARIINNREGTAGWFDIPVEKPDDGEHGARYWPNDASVGDLTGNGEYDIVLKWEPDNAKDNSQSGTTDNVLLDAYTMDGAHLWRIDLGPNIRAGAHYTQFLVYDFDGDGRAEIMVKTAPGTKDGTGNYINKGPAAVANHSLEYRNSGGYILSGPEYITVFDGKTGEELATSNYWPVRGDVGSWGDTYGNRLDRYNAAVAYVDGEKPSGVFQRGYYTRLTMSAWDWRDGKLTRKWTFDSNSSGNGAYAGQGNHSIHVIDADGDGRHDLVTGAAVISGDGTGMHTSGMGHGDATHVTYMYKDETRPMIYMPHESGGHGVSLRYADDGEMLFNHRLEGADVGRGVGAHIDPNYPGFQFWASNGLGLYNKEGRTIGRIPNSANFLIWWDGDLARELLNSNKIDKWNIADGRATNLLTGHGTTWNNGTKSTPTLSADIFGDWREELILRRDDGKALRIYVSAIPTEHKLYTLMHDPIYRVAISWQNSSYNQPPHPGFYLASDMDFPQATPDVEIIDKIKKAQSEFVKDLYILDLENHEGWEVMNNLAKDDQVFSDLEFYFEDGPGYLFDKQWVRTNANSRRIKSPVNLAYFTARTKTTVFIVHQKSISKKPKWLDEWTLTDETVYIRNAGGSKIPMHLFKRDFAKDEIVNLGANTIDGAVGRLMYFVVVNNGVISSIDVNEALSSDILVYPNPFAEFANVEFTLISEQNVDVSLYDISGRSIRNIENGFKAPGRHIITVDSNGLNSGVYIIKVAAGKRVFYKKIIISK